ncbi:uncharacterized protein BO80DRAFT_422808 [Aspergillus ibericus CBS 121593]|uniref:Uncharacterized protein n=1 Tax=Aspergillus ibericus CBS 121593 TaxID=1448316 RepID=A0A395HAF6_9EURO|nr:hypothetical protein BO80DRAFT_422808 [Aspergillus ibericus CBS 121593]RAL03898.1 hypothetical protein BO80DRAFT_422808 [Aspergillus ibericus CBS 121593]
MVVQDLALLLVYLGHKSHIPSLWITALGATVGVAIITSTIILSFFLIRVLLRTRQLVSLSDEPQTVLGKPLLFPMIFNHTRFVPVKDQFSNRFLAVGVPVGLRCRIGNLLAVDDPTLDLHGPPGQGWSWTRTLSHLSCWFSFDSERYLHRGDHQLDLREKLDGFLRDQNQDPAQWPYAYLLGIPQFLGWSRSVVSWWYLYTADRELDAMILEINNSYDEKRNIFMKVSRVSDPPLHPPESTQKEFLDHSYQVRSLPSRPQSTFYKGVWTKHIFASVFEKVDGLVTNRFMDPLQPASWKPNASFSNMTTIAESGEVKMVTRMTCREPAIDPTQMTSLQLLKFLLHWTVPGLLTTAHIVFQALLIHYTGLMKMYVKTPVRTGSVGRHATQTEIDLEGFFRAYLASRVEKYPHPVELTYLPCRSFSTETITLRSAACQGDGSSIRRVSIEPTDPGFYTRIVNYPDIETALNTELHPTGLHADPSSQRLLVSDQALLASILTRSLQTKPFILDSKKETSHIWGRYRANTPSFMDDFVSSRSSDPSRVAYFSIVSKRRQIDRFAFGSETLLGIYTFLGACLVRWVVLEFITRGGDVLEGGIEMAAVGLVGYFLSMRGVGVVGGWKGRWV